MKKLGMILVVVMLVVACNGNTTAPTPVTDDQQVRLSFIMEKGEWYDCGIAVTGNHSRAITILVNGQRVGSIQMGSPVRTARFDMVVKPGTYNYKAIGEDWKYRQLTWAGVALANYPNGAATYLTCIGYTD